MFTKLDVIVKLYEFVKVYLNHSYLNINYNSIMNCMQVI
jgi:hypothetical protein